MKTDLILGHEVVSIFLLDLSFQFHVQEKKIALDSLTVQRKGIIQWYGVQ